MSATGRVEADEVVLRPDGGRIAAVCAGAREAELLAEYAGGARSLTQTYGRWHGNRARAFRLGQLAAAARALARSLREQAALLRTVAAA